MIYLFITLLNARAVHFEDFFFNFVRKIREKIPKLFIINEKYFEKLITVFDLVLLECHTKLKILPCIKLTNIRSCLVPSQLKKKIENNF